MSYQCFFEADWKKIKLKTKVENRKKGKNTTAKLYSYSYESYLDSQSSPWEVG